MEELEHASGRYGDFARCCLNEDVPFHFPIVKLNDAGEKVKKNCGKSESIALFAIASGGVFHFASFVLLTVKDSTNVLLAP